MVAEIQKDMLTRKWGEISQQQVFQGEPKAKRPQSVCYCLSQKDYYQEFLADPPVYDTYSS